MHREAKKKRKVLCKVLKCLRFIFSSCEVTKINSRGHSRSGSERH